MEQGEQVLARELLKRKRLWQYVIFLLSFTAQLAIEYDNILVITKTEVREQDDSLLSKT